MLCKIMRITHAQIRNFMYFKVQTGACERAHTCTREKYNEPYHIFAECLTIKEQFTSNLHRNDLFDNTIKYD